MCGGLVTASCEKSNDVFRYQIGRLIGYLFLGVFAGLLGSMLEFRSLPDSASLVPGFFLGGLFIWWGIQNFRGKRAELPMPKIFGKIYSKLWTRLVHKNQTFSKSFFTGLISIMLPCGLLYGVVLGTVALQNTGSALLSMFFFWLGTVPSMVVAPEIIRKCLKPLKSKLPKTYAIGLITIGVMTITFRVVKLQELQKHDRLSGELTHKSCH
jgi:sulfite exporter TauE/SafE